MQYLQLAGYRIGLIRYRNKEHDFKVTQENLLKTIDRTNHTRAISFYTTKQKVPLKTEIERGQENHEIISCQHDILEVIS